MFNISQLIIAMQWLFPVRTLASDMEEYITAKRPQSASDVERYEREFNQKISKGGWLWKNF